MVDPNLSLQTMNDSPLREIYVSTDIETDGPVAGKHSMLSIGSAAYLADKELLGTFSGARSTRRWSRAQRRAQANRALVDEELSLTRERGQGHDGQWAGLPEVADQDRIAGHAPTGKRKLLAIAGPGMEEDLV